MVVVSMDDGELRILLVVVHDVVDVVVLVVGGGQGQKNQGWD